MNKQKWMSNRISNMQTIINQKTADISQLIKRVTLLENMAGQFENVTTQNIIYMPDYTQPPEPIYKYIKSYESEQFNGTDTITMCSHTDVPDGNYMISASMIIKTNARAKAQVSIVEDGNVIIWDDIIMLDNTAGYNVNIRTMRHVDSTKKIDLNIYSSYGVALSIYEILFHLDAASPSNI